MSLSTRQTLQHLLEKIDLHASKNGIDTPTRKETSALVSEVSKECIMFAQAFARLTSITSKIADDCISAAHAADNIKAACGSTESLTDLSDMLRNRVLPTLAGILQVLGVIDNLGSLTTDMLRVIPKKLTTDTEFLFETWTTHAKSTGATNPAIMVGVEHAKSMNVEMQEKRDSVEKVMANSDNPTVSEFQEGNKHGISTGQEDGATNNENGNAGGEWGDNVENLVPQNHALAAVPTDNENYNGGDKRCPHVEHWVPQHDQTAASAGGAETTGQEVPSEDNEDVCNFIEGRSVSSGENFLPSHQDKTAENSTGVVEAVTTSHQLIDTTDQPMVELASLLPTQRESAFSTCSAGEFCLNPPGKNNYYGYDCNFCERWIHYDCAAVRKGRTDLVCHVCWKRDNKVGKLKHWIPSDDPTWKEKKEEYLNTKPNATPKGIVPFSLTMKRRCSVADYNYAVYDLRDKFSSCGDDGYNAMLLEIQAKHGIALQNGDDSNKNQQENDPVLPENRDQETVSTGIDTRSARKRQRPRSALSSQTRKLICSSNKRSAQQPSQGTFVMAILHPSGEMPYTVVKEKEYSSKRAVTLEVLEEDPSDENRFLDRSRWINRGRTIKVTVSHRNRLRSRMVLARDGTMKGYDIFGILFKMVNKHSLAMEASDLIGRTSESWQNQTTGLEGSENVSMLDYMQELINRNLLEREG